MIAFIVIICIAAFIGGFLQEMYIDKHYSEEQKRQRSQRQKETAKAVGLGLTIGAVEVFRTVLKEKK